MKRFWHPIIVIAVLANSACSTPPDMDQKSSTDAKNDSGRTLKDLHRNGVTRPGGIGGFGR